MLYLIAFIFNMSTLQTSIVRNCVEIKEDKMNEEIELAAATLKGMDLNCVKGNPSTYTCKNLEKHMTGVVTVKRDLAKCKSMPDDMVKDYKQMSGL